MPLAAGHTSAVSGHMGLGEDLDVISALVEGKPAVGTSAAAPGRYRKAFVFAAPLCEEGEGHARAVAAEESARDRCWSNSASLSEAT